MPVLRLSAAMPLGCRPFGHNQNSMSTGHVYKSHGLQPLYNISFLLSKVEPLLCNPAVYLPAMSLIGRACGQKRGQELRTLSSKQKKVESVDRWL